VNVASYGKAAVVAPQIPGHDQNPNLAAGSNPTVLADIYESKTNIAIWQRSLSESLQCLVDEFVASRQQLCTSVICTRQMLARSCLRNLVAPISARWSMTSMN